MPTKRQLVLPASKEKKLCKKSRYAPIAEIVPQKEKHLKKSNNAPVVNTVSKRKDLSEPHPSSSCSKQTSQEPKIPIPKSRLPHSVQLFGLQKKKRMPLRDIAVKLTGEKQVPYFTYLKFTIIMFFSLEWLLQVQLLRGVPFLRCPVPEKGRSCCSTGK